LLLALLLIHAFISGELWLSESSLVLVESSSELEVVVVVELDHSLCVLWLREPVFSWANVAPVSVKVAAKRINLCMPAAPV
jgi:hypothetical protein